MKRGNRLLLWLWIFSAASVLCGLALFSVSPNYTLRIPADSIGSIGGNSYGWRIGRLSSLLFSVPSDQDGPDLSTLHVLESGRALSFPHTSHEEIRLGGAGRFSHWADYLYFPASDNSDPRLNGRSYQAVVQAKPRFSLLLAVTFCAVFAPALTLAEAIRLLFSARHAIASACARLARVVLVPLALLIVGAQVFPLMIPFEIPPNQIQHVSEREFSWQIPKIPGIRDDSDSSESPLSSKTLLEENGAPLGPAHQQHSVIAEGDRGGYSHWSGALLFSTADGSDPRANARFYRAKLRIAPAAWLLLIAISVLIRPVISIGRYCLLSIAWTLQVAVRAGCSAVAEVTAFLIGALFAALRFCVRATPFAAAVSGGLVLAVWIVPVNLELTLMPAGITQLDGYAFARRLSAGPFFEPVADDSFHPFAKTAEMTEGDTGAVMIRADRQSVSLLGSGRFALPQGLVVFSASDSSDPRVTGRTYRLRLRQAPADWVLSLAVGCLAILSFRRYAARAKQPSVGEGSPVFLPTAARFPVEHRATRTRVFNATNRPD